MLQQAVWLGLIAGLGCAGHAVVARPFDDGAVRNVLFAQRDAWNRGDLDGYMGGYEHSDRLVFTAGGKIRHGWQETFDTYKAKYGAAPIHVSPIRDGTPVSPIRDGTPVFPMGHLEFELLDVRAVGSDGAVVLGRWTLDGPAAGAGVFSVILERGRDGRWLVVHDHTSSD